MVKLEGRLKKIIPTGAQRREVERVASELLDKVKSLSKRIPHSTSVRLVGSVAKGTYIYRPDIDIFVLFPPELTRSELERFGLEVGRRAIGGEERYAEHPYIHGEYQGFEVDIVPCFAVDDPTELRSAVDRTPFHTDYVIANLAEGQRDQVRILKQFMRGIGVYGAEAKVRGFSGYLVELLVLKYGGFEKVLEGAKDWTEGVTLSLTDAQGPRFSAPMVFHDPVDRGRNVASALSSQCFATFVQACKEYLSAPNERFFFPKPRRTWTRARLAKEMKRRGTRLVAVQLPCPELTDDDLYPQARKTLEGMASTLDSGDFVVLDRSMTMARGKITLLAELQADRLPKGKRHVGPPATSVHASRFLEKWATAAIVPPYIEEGRWVAVIERTNVDASSLIRTEMSKASLGSGMRGLKGMRVISHPQLMRSGPLGAMTELLDKTFPWKR